MTDDELRALVRDAIARHLGPSTAAVSPVDRSGRDSAATPPWRSHVSFARFLNLPADTDARPCLIEPAVQCNHCGFCQSYGH